MKFRDGVLILRYNKKTGRWYHDKPTERKPYAMTSYVLVDGLCKGCGDRFFTAIGNKGNCCSLRCNALYRNFVYGTSAETGRKISASNIGRKKNVPPETQKRLSEFRRQRFLGDRNPAWKGGVTSENQKIYNSKEYRNWRTYIYERDKYTCQMCDKIGGKIEAHHIRRYCDYPELRFIEDNGITLCRECHYSVKDDEIGYVNIFKNILESKNPLTNSNSCDIIKQR